MRMTGQHPAAGHEWRYRNSRSLHFGLRKAQHIDSALAWARAMLETHAKRRLGL